MNSTQPQIGQIVIVYGIKCEIFCIHPLGVIDVVALDGSKAWRLSGCPVYADMKD